MDPITRNLKRTVSIETAPSVNYFSSTTVKDNISNTTIFTNERTSQLTVSPFTFTSETKLVDTSDFSTYTETPNIFPISGWGSGSNKHSSYALWYKSEYPNSFTKHGFAVSDNNSIIAVHNFESTKIKVSTDAGSTWVDSTTTFPAGSSGFGNLFYSEQKFWMFSTQGSWTSTDGMTWVTGGTSNYETANWRSTYGTPNFTVGYNAMWTGSTYQLTLSTIKNNVVTTGPTITTPNFNIAFANKTSGYNTTSFALAVMGENVYQLSWNGTAASITDLGFRMFGKYVPGIFYDETNSRWLALVLPTSNWAVGNKIQESFDDGLTWTDVADIPDSYSNKSIIFIDLLGRIVISGNSIGVAIYDETSNTWLAGDNQERISAIRQLNASTHITTFLNWRRSFSDTITSIVNMPTLAEGPLSTNRKWHGYTNGPTSIIQHFSSDGYNTFANVTPTFLNAGYNPYIPSGNTGPSYITRSASTINARATAGANYDNIHYLMTSDNTGTSNYQVRPMATVNVWRSTDSGNTYNITSNFAYTPTYYDTNLVNFGSGLPGWTDATAPTNSEICYSRLIAEPSYSTALNINNRIACVTPASINDMIYQDSAFWAWGHNGQLMTSPSPGTDFFNPSWRRFPALQDLCLGSRITAFCKEGSKLFVFTNLGQCIVSLDLGVTWTDRTSAIRTAGLNGTSSVYTTPMAFVPLGCIYTNGKLIAIANNGVYESTDDAVTWTKNAFNTTTLGKPSAIAKHPTSDVVIIGTYEGISRVGTSALSSFASIPVSTSNPVCKIIWAGTRWYVFYDNNTTNYGRYAYSDTVNPTNTSNWTAPTNAFGATALPTTEYIGGVGGNVVTTNAYWDGARMIVTDYVNNQVYMSDGVTNNWQNISNGIRGYSDSTFKNKLKHVWTVASNGTTMVAAGDMCDAVASTPANALSATKWSFTMMKNNSGVVDPVISYETEIYVANVSVSSAGSGYSASGISSMLSGLTLNSANPSKPNGGVKPIFANAATNNTNGGISWINIDNSGYTHGYTGTESTSCTLSGSSGGFTGSGFIGTLNFRRKPTNVKIRNLGRGFGPMNVSNPTYTNDGACAEVYFMGNPTNFVSNTSNLCPMKIALGQRTSTNLPVYTSSNQPLVLLFGNDEDGFLYGKSGSGVFSFNINKTNAVSRFGNGRTSSRASEDKGVNWSGHFFHKTVKPLFTSSTSMTLMNNKGYPIMESMNEHRSRASIYMTEGGLIYQSAINKLLYSGWNFESDGTTIEIYPFLIPAALQNGTLKIDDSYTNLLASVKSDLVITLSGSDVTQFANTNPINQRYVYPTPIQFSDNAVSEKSLANTMIVTVTKPKTAIGNMSFPTYTLDDTFWYKGTLSNGATTWTDISASIRTATRSLTVPAGTTDTELTQYAPNNFRWSGDDGLWYAASKGIHYWTSPDLNTWTVVQDPAGTWPQYPN
jgi:hypothetical protein